MTVSNAQTNTAFNDRIINDYSLDTISAPEEWIRNPCWLPMPSVANTEQKFVSLMAVDEYASNVALSVTMANFTTFQYTVDWGDGVVENFTSGVTAQHQYRFDNAALANTDGPVTFQSSTDTVTRTNHGYTDGMKIKFAKINTTTGIVANKLYYVVNASANTFQVSESSGGSAIDLVNDGTGSILPYKQAIMTITSTRDISAINLNLRPTTHAATNVYESSYLDLILSLPLAATITFSSTTVNTRHSRLERASILNAGFCTNLNYLFYLCYSLQKIDVLHIPKTCTDITGMFQACLSLQKNGIPALDTKNVVTFTSMFNTCYSIDEVPIFDTKNGVTFSSMFANCQALKRVPQYNLLNATTINNMFQNCYALVDIPPLLTSEALNNMNSTFSGCFALKKAPYINTKKVFTADNLFASCYSLREVPLLDMSNAITISNMFSACYTLRKVPRYNFSNAVIATSIFSNCLVLDNISDFDFSNVQLASSMFFGCYSLKRVKCKFGSNLSTVNSMFNGCYALEEVPDTLDTSKATSHASMFASCYSLKKIPDLDLSSSISALSMFEGCYSLEYAPELKNTSKVTTMAGMFGSCYRLRYIPEMDTRSVTTFSTFAFACYSLEYVPRLNLQSCTTTYRMFYDCRNLKNVAGLDNMGLSADMREMFYNNVSIRVIPPINANSVASATNLTAFPALYSCYDMNLSNTKYSFSITNCKLSANALNKIYTSLPTVVGQTITVTGNWGTATDNVAIATAKGWTVTG